LQKLDFPLNKYYLVVNRDIFKEEREALEAELLKIKEDGKIEYYEVLDLRLFMNFLAGLIQQKFESAISNSNMKLYEQYKEKLDQRFYFGNVPFEVNEHRTTLNPSSFLKNGFKINDMKEKRTPNEFERSKYFFVIGDFGFGKTSLLFQSLLGLENYNALYLPLSYFKKRDFQNQLEFVMVINKFVTGEDIDMKNTFLKFKARVLSNILNNDPQLVLLFDGMDENLFLGTTEGLRLLFSILNPIKSKCVFSMRKSFWDERRGNLETTMPKGRIHKDRIMLLEWENNQIFEYIQLYKNNHSLSQRQNRNLDDFSEIIKSNKYQQYYGDIPKRPLFLEMIVQDAIEGNIKETLVSELYDKYFYRKFIWDNESKFSEIPSGRPFSYKEDVYKGFANMCKIMEKVAGSMINEKQIVVFLNPLIEENKIEPILNEYGIDSLQSLLLNSVLTTGSERTKEGILIKFAHKSFQEYFTARFLCNEILNNHVGWLTEARLVFADTVYSFVVNYLELKHRENGILSNPAFTELAKTSWPHNSLGDIITIVIKKH
jgi:hypothetical protein